MQFRKTLPLTLCVGCIGSLCAAQTPVTFSTITSTAGPTPANIYAVDLNNDGITDIVQDVAQSSAAFTVSINNGNGSFKAPVQYSVPISGSGIPQPIASGDFNNDGKVDLAVVLAGLNGTGQIAVYPGNGDGTFQSPKLSNITLPSGYHLSFVGPGAADFNGDGKLDLAVSAGDQNGVSELYVLPGDGAGGFAATPYPVFSGGAIQIAVGDFDSDGKADIALTQFATDIAGNVVSTTVSVLYGASNFTFTDTTAYIANSRFTIASGDLNSDGFTDLFGFSPTQLGTFYGNSSRTFSNYFSSLPAGFTTAPSGGSTWQPQLAMGDFNGDGRMDLVSFNYVSIQGGSDEYLAFFLAGITPGSFTTQLVTVANNYPNDTPPVAGLFGGNFLTPDVTFNQALTTQNSPSYLATYLNKANRGYFGPCYYPKTGQGFNVCNAGTVSGSAATFNAAVNSYGKLRKIELWVDGKKVSEQHHTWNQHGYFNYSSTFAAGTHNATFFAADVDNRLQRYDFTFTGSGGCAPPSSNGVSVCSPGNYTTVKSPVQATASANIRGYGSLVRMEIWADGKKVYTETTSLTESYSLILSPGTHQLAFYAVASTGMQWENGANITVQ